MERIDYTKLFKRHKNQKYSALFTFKPELDPVVHCAFHPSEGCDDCVYINRCALKEDGFFIV